MNKEEKLCNPCNKVIGLMQLHEIEQWKDVYGYEGTYIISNKGIVRSKFKRLKPAISTSGWRQIVLRKDNFGESVKIHRLVAKHFIPNPNNYSGVKAIKNKLDCRASNLKWVENAQDRKMSKPDLIRYYDGLDKSNWDETQLSLYNFVKTGDSKYLAKIFTDLYNNWYGYLLKRVKNEDDAQDLLQDSYEAFTECVNSGRFRIERCIVKYAVESYMKRLIKNSITNWRRKQIKTVSFDDSYDQKGNYEL